MQALSVQQMSLFLFSRFTHGEAQAGESPDRNALKAGLAHIYTPHCIRATSVTVLKAVGLENCRVRRRHASDKSIASYSARPTIEQQFESSAIVRRFVTRQNPDQPSLAAASSQAISALAATSSTAIQQRNQEVYQQSTFSVNPSSASD